MADSADDNSGKLGGEDKRPRVTLDLKATDVTQDDGARKALPPLENEEPSEPEARHTAQPAPRPASGGAAMLMTHLAAGLAGGLMALVAAFYGVDRFRDRLVVLSGETAESLRAELSAAQTRVAALEKASAEATPAVDAQAIEQQAVKAAQASLGAALARVDSLEQKLAAAPTEPLGVSDAQVKAVIAPIEQRVAAVEAKVAAVVRTQSAQKSSVAATALAVAISNLRRAVANGRAYAAEFDAVAKLGASEADLSALAVGRETGLKSVEALEKAFSPLAKTALRASEGKDDASFVSRLWTEAKSVVRVRRTGEAIGEDLEAVIARAETRLRARDLPAAIKEVETIAGEAGVILQPWLKDAKGRAAADATLDQIEAKLLASLKPEGQAQ
jgi:hypothetical protein